MYYAIIAAGEGSRLRNEGIDAPKPLVRIGGRTLIERLIEIFRSQADCEAVSVIISPEVAAQAPKLDADHVVTASTDGSMESLQRLAPCLKGCVRFCLTTVDTVFVREEFDRYMEAFRKGYEEGYDGCMGVTTYVDDEKPLYVATDADDTVTGYFDTPPEGVRYVSGGIYGLPESALDVLDECMASGKRRMRDLQRALIASGMRLKAWPLGCVIDIDHAADIEKAARLISGEAATGTAQPPASS